MGLLISVLGQKGGPGKSTIARAIATCYAASGWEVKISDLDINQATSFEWQQRRLSNNIEPNVAVEVFGTPGQALKQLDHYDLMVTDGAPTASRATNEVAQRADMVVIPTGLSLDDLKPSVVLAHNLKKNGVDASKICFVLNKHSGSLVELQDARDYLGQTPYHLVDGQIDFKTCYSLAMNEGRSIIETQFKKPREKAEAAIQGIIDRIEELTN